MSATRAAVGLRPAGPADVEALSAVHVATWRETYQGLLPEAMLAGLTVDSRAAMWRLVLARPAAFWRTLVMVAESEGRMIGFGSCCDQRDPDLARRGYTGEIGAIYLLRQDQGRGLGRAMMQRLGQALRDAGHEAASLWVLRGNARAHGFYTALGGEQIAERIDSSGEAPLAEVAYGWGDLAALIG